MSSTSTRTSSCLDSSPSHSDGGRKYVSNKKKVRMTDERDQDRDRDQESGKQRTVSTISTDLPPARPSRFYLLYPVLTFMVERCVVRMNSLLMQYMNQSDLGGSENTGLSKSGISTVPNLPDAQSEFFNSPSIFSHWRPVTQRFGASHSL